MNKHERHITGIWLLSDPFVKEILRPIQFNILVRKLFKGQSYREIGTALKIPADAIENAFKGIVKRQEAHYDKLIKGHFDEIELLLAINRDLLNSAPNWPEIYLN